MRVGVVATGVSRKGESEWESSIRVRGVEVSRWGKVGEGDLEVEDEREEDASDEDDIAGRPGRPVAKSSCAAGMATTGDVVYF